MRVSWEPAASTPRHLPVGNHEVKGGSSASCLSTTTTLVNRKNGSWPLPETSTTETQLLREEVERLREGEELHAKEREMLLGKIELLQAELRRSLDDNRALTEGIEERKRHLDSQAAARESAAKEAALNSAKELFRSMLEANEANRPRRSTRSRATGGPTSAVGRSASRSAAESPLKRRHSCQAGPASEKTCP